MITLQAGTEAAVYGIRGQASNVINITFYLVILMHKEQPDVLIDILFDDTVVDRRKPQIEWPVIDTTHPVSDQIGVIGKKTPVNYLIDINDMNLQPIHDSAPSVEIDNIVRVRSAHHPGVLHGVKLSDNLLRRIVPQAVKQDGKVMRSQNRNILIAPPLD